MINRDDNSQISFSDLLEGLKKKKSFLFIACFCGALLALLIALLRMPLYEADASFKERNKALQGDSSKANYLSLLIGTSDLNEGAISTLKSRKLIERVVLKRNLQANFDNSSFWNKRLSYPLKNLKIEYGYLTNQLEPVIEEDKFPLKIETLIYDNDVPRYLTIRMTSEDTFIVSDRTGLELGAGNLYEPFEHPTFSFILGKKGPDSIANREFSLNLMPLLHTVKQMNDLLTTEQDPLDKNLILLFFKHPDRTESVEFLNDLMLTYQIYQRDEQKRITGEQIAYLNSRQERSENQLKETMEKHARSLSSNMSNMDLLIQNQENYAQKLLNINLELSRLANVKKQGTAYYDRSEAETGDSIVINGLLNEIRNLKHQEETLQNSFHSDIPVDEAVAAEFKSLDLSNATHLYSEQCKSLNNLEGECRQQQFVLQQLQDPSFEITSLSSVNDDKVSNDIIARAIEIELMLNDHNNRTTREMDRLREELEQQKKFLANHVKESHRLLDESKKYTAQKIAALQSLSLGLIRNKIDVLNHQLSHYVDERIKTLVHEKNALKTQQLVIQKEMQKLPAKWASEKIVEQQLETNKTIAEEITSMVESKLISANIDISQSGPLDNAYSPIHPKRPHLLLFTFLGATVGFLIALTWVLLKMEKKNSQV